MNHDDIISMAREAGVRIAGPMDLVHQANVYSHELLRFAHLLLDAEREECAKVVEREAAHYREPTWAFEIVNNIRARGEE